MKSKTLLAMAVAGAFACSTGAMAYGVHHSTEVQTPASVDESAPWLTGQPHLPQSIADTTETVVLNPTMELGQISDASLGTGGTVDTGMGTVGYDSTTSSASGEPAIAEVTFVEYWLLGDDSNGMGTSSSLSRVGDVAYDSMSDSSMSVAGNLDYSLLGDGAMGTGTTSSAGGSGIVAFDSSTSGSSDEYALDTTSNFGEPLAVVYTPGAEQIAAKMGDATPLISEHYLVAGPLSSFDGSSVIVLEAGPAPEDVALLDKLSRDFYVLTPIDPLADA
jgi:hypothetical protein